MKSTKLRASSSASAVNNKKMVRKSYKIKRT